MLFGLGYLVIHFLFHFLFFFFCFIFCRNDESYKSFHSEDFWGTCPNGCEARKASATHTHSNNSKKAYFSCCKSRATIMITLHHLKHSQSFRIVWLLEELGVDYRLKLYERLPSQLAPDDYKAISPLGTAPVITIIDYILDTVADAKNLRPAAGDPMRTKYLFWFHASAASLQAVLNTETIFRILPTKTFWPVSAILRMVQAKVNESYIHPRLYTILDLAEAQLKEQNSYLAGNALTAADITAIYSFDTIFSRIPEAAQQYPSCKAWFDRLQKREAFQTALRKVGQTSIGLDV
jgi:glutathione S-transferase